MSLVRRRADLVAPAERLLGLGVDLDTVNSLGNTALAHAINKRLPAAIRFLMKKGACTKQRWGLDVSVLRFVYKRHLRDLIPDVLQEGAQLDEMNASGCSALICSAKDGILKTVQRLLEHDAPVDTCNRFGYTALLKASSNSRLSVVELLLKRGANAVISDARGSLASDLADGRNEMPY